MTITAVTAAAVVATAAGTGHFRVGEQSDANETLEAILDSIHR